MARRAGTPRRPHDEPAYQHFRAALKRYPQPCSVPGCPRPGDTVDHASAIALHDHVEGTRCCVLRPMCRPHNSSFGRLVAARRTATRKYGPVTRDSCEVCGRPLRTSERVELVEVVPAYVDPEAGVGGGGISATYCPDHAP